MEIQKNEKQENGKKEKQDNENKDWKSDPRLAMMDEKKLAFLSEFSERMKTIPKERAIPFLLSLHTEAANRRITFSDSETMLIASVLSTDMSPEQKKRMEFLRLFAKRNFKN